MTKMITTKLKIEGPKSCLNVLLHGRGIQYCYMANVGVGDGWCWCTENGYTKIFMIFCHRASGAGLIILIRKT